MDVGKYKLEEISVDALIPPSAENKFLRAEQWPVERGTDTLFL